MLLDGSIEGRVSLKLVIQPSTVRESPPPTPREAYLPQRPERAHRRGNDCKLSKLSKQSEKLTLSHTEIAYVFIVYN